jgi:hypothetical protein
MEAKIAEDARKKREAQAHEKGLPVPVEEDSQREPLTGVTNTRLRDSRNHVAFENGEMQKVPAYQSGVPVRLAVVLSSRPVGWQYLPKKAATS